MDGLGFAAVVRARDALEAALQGTHEQDRHDLTLQRRAAFLEYAAALMSEDGTGQVFGRCSRLVRQHLDATAARMKAAASGMADIPNPDLPGAFLESIAERSLLDSLAIYAVPLPQSGRALLIATGAVGDAATEGFPKLVRRQGLSVGEREPLKSISLVALSVELARNGGTRFLALLERELTSAVVRATNAAVLGTFVDSGTTSLPGTGDALADLRAGLAASQPSDGYVVAAGTGHAADLATRAENRGMGIRGGMFTPGVHIVAVDELSGLVVIPASRTALWAGDLELSRAEHADLNMADDLQGEPVRLPLWQSNSVALRAERLFHLAGDAESVAVGVES